VLAPIDALAWKIDQSGKNNEAPNPSLGLDFS
jgi:hypothetical protein